MEQVADLAPFLEPDAVRRRWRRVLGHGGDHRVMYTLIVLLGWLETHPIDS